MYTLFLICVLVVSIALGANFVQRLGKAEPLSPIKPWTKICKLHIWKQVVLLHPTEYDTYLKNPDKFKETTYCDTCGYMPSLKKLLKENFRLYLRQREVAENAAKQRVQDIQETKEEFFAAAVEAVDRVRIGDIRLGFDIYDKYVEALPELVKKKELTRLWKQLGGVTEAPPPENVTYLGNRLN